MYWSSRPVLCITNNKPIATISSSADMSANTIAPVDSTPYEGLGPIHLLNVDTHSGSSFRSSFDSSYKNESGEVVQRKYTSVEFLSKTLSRCLSIKQSLTWTFFTPPFRTILFVLPL